MSTVCGNKELPTGKSTHKIIKSAIFHVLNDQVLDAIVHKDSTSPNESANWSVNSKTTKRKRLGVQTHKMQVARGILTNQVGEQSILDRKRSLGIHISTNQQKEAERMMKKRKINNERSKNHNLKKEKYLKKHNITESAYQTGCVLKEMQNINQK